MTFKTYLVGGAVRDELLGIPSKDNDYVCVCSFEELKASLLAQGAVIFVEKPEFVTIRCKHPTLGCVDFACARCDGNYSDGRRPDSVSLAETIEQDLSRRDCTINAIARDLDTGELIDPFNGRQDIEDRVIRAVGNPVERLQEDKLRAFRYLRFSVTKDMRLHDTLYGAIDTLHPTSFQNVSTERVREELFKMFKWDSVEAMGLLLSFPKLMEVVQNKGIWFEPTTRD